MGNANVVGHLRSVYIDSSMIVIALRLVLNLPIKGYVGYPVNIINRSIHGSLIVSFTLSIGGVSTMTVPCLSFLLPCLLCRGGGWCLVLGLVKLFFMALGGPFVCFRDRRYLFV